MESGYTVPHDTLYRPYKTECDQKKQTLKIYVQSNQLQLFTWNTSHLCLITVRHHNDYVLH